MACAVGRLPIQTFGTLGPQPARLRAPMDWPTHPDPLPLSESGWVNTLYLSQPAPKSDPTIVWGTSVDVELLESFIAEHGRVQRIIISPAHVLVAAVAASLRAHPPLNRRVIGKRAYRYSGINV